MVSLAAEVEGGDSELAGAEARPGSCSEHATARRRRRQAASGSSRVSRIKTKDIHDESLLSIGGRCGHCKSQSAQGGIARVQQGLEEARRSAPLCEEGLQSFGVVGTVGHSSWHERAKMLQTEIHKPSKRTDGTHGEPLVAGTRMKPVRMRTGRVKMKLAAVASPKTPRSRVDGAKRCTTRNMRACGLAD